MRWESAFRAEGIEEISALWRTREDARAVLIGGAGFDPRGPAAYECISAACPQPVDVIQVRLEPIPTDAETEGLASQARERVQAAVESCGGSLRDHGAVATGASSTALMIARDFFEADLIDGYDEVVIDVSAMPRTVFFPLVKGILEKFDSGSWKGNFHVVACDNPSLDALMTGQGAEAPAALPGFGARFLHGDEGTPIWVPVLGEGEVSRVGTLYEDIGAQEICPVLPFPAADPRRGDDLVREYRELLVERMGVEPRNFIYAAESNPLDLYRSLSRLNERYAEALKPLGDTRMILSAHSSKLLSVGVLLAAYEQVLEVRHSSPSIYTMETPEAAESMASANLLVDLWLTGEPYLNG